MDEVRNKLVKDVADLRWQMENQLSEERVREIVKEELEAAKPPQRRPFGLPNRVKKGSVQTQPVKAELEPQPEAEPVGETEPAAELEPQPVEA